MKNHCLSELYENNNCLLKNNICLTNYKKNIYPNYNYLKYI